MANKARFQKGMLKLPVSKAMSTMTAVDGRMAPTMKPISARIPPRRLPLFVRLSPKNPSKKPEVKNHKTKVSANPQNPPHQPSEKPKATNPKVANNIAKSDTQSRESLPGFVREIAGVEQRNNLLSMAGPAKDSTRLDGKTDMRCRTLALGRFALAMPMLSIRVDCMSNWGEQVGKGKAAGGKFSSTTKSPNALASAWPSALLALFPNKNDIPPLRLCMPRSRGF